MSKNLVKFLSLFVVLLMVLTAIAGCGAKPADTDASTDTGEENVESPPSEDNPEPAPEEPTYDFGGRTIRMGAWFDAVPQAGRTEWEDKLIARLAEMEEKYNFKSDYVNVPWDQYVEKFTASTLAGEPFAEVAQVPIQWFFPGFVANGFLYPVSDLGVFDFNEEKWNDTTINVGTYNGKVYGFMTGKFYPREMIWWNKTMFEREGLPNLYELRDNKTWTWDKMLEIAKKATKDLDGDGTIDQWGLGGSNVPEAFVVSNGGNLMKMDGTKPLFTLNEPAAIEALQYYQDLLMVHKVYDIAPDGAPWDYATQDFVNGKIAMHPNEVWVGDSFAENMQDEYGLTLFPIGPRMDHYVSVAPTTDLMVIPSTVEKPEEVAIFWDKRSDPYPDEDPEAWKEGYEKFAKDGETLETIEMIADSTVPTEFWFIQSFQELWEMSWTYMWGINTGNKTPQVAIDEIAEQAQAVLDDAFANAK